MTFFPLTFADGSMTNIVVMTYEIFNASFSHCDNG